MTKIKRKSGYQPAPLERLFCAIFFILNGLMAIACVLGSFFVLMLLVGSLVIIAIGGSDWTLIVGLLWSFILLVVFAGMSSRGTWILFRELTAGNTSLENEQDEKLKNDAKQKSKVTVEP